MAGISQICGGSYSNLVHWELVVFLGKYIEWETLCIYRRTKSVGSREKRQKGFIKSVNMAFDT